MNGVLGHFYALSRLNWAEYECRLNTATEMMNEGHHNGIQNFNQQSAIYNAVHLT